MIISLDLKKESSFNFELIDENKYYQEEKIPILLCGPLGLKKEYNNKSKINIIFEDNSSNKNEYKASIIIECSLDDKVSSLFEKYQNKTGNNYNKKIFAFENFELLPDLTIEEASLYTGCTVKIYDA